MRYPRFYPLISCDTESINLMPMFPSEDKETVLQNHKFVLEETSKNRFNTLGKTINKNTIIHCPKCGNAMTQI